jgi:hypothetical protein
MAKFKRSNRASTNGNMEQLVVLSGDQALSTGALVDGTTAFNIADGQAGVLSWDFDGSTSLGNFITAGETASQVKAVKLLQGTPKSSSIHTADSFEVGDKAKVESGIIYRENVRSVTTTLPRQGRYGAQALTDLATPLDNTEYGLNVYLNSVRNDRDWSDNDEVITDVFQSPDFTTLATVNPLDYIVKTSLYRLNFKSRVVSLSNSAASRGNRDVIGFAINTAGGTGTAIGTITCGTSIPVMTDGSVTTNFDADEKLITALAQIIFEHNADATVTDKITGTSTIELIDTASAGTVAAGAGNAAANAMVVIGLDDTTAAYSDNIKETAKTIQADLTLGYRSETFSSLQVMPFEYLNSGRNWSIENSDRAQIQVHTMQNHPHGEFFSEGASYVDSSKSYTSTIIDYYDWEDTLTVTQPSEKQLIILLEATIPCVTVATAVTNLATTDAMPASTTDTTTVASLNASFGAWLDSAVQFSGHVLKGSAATGANFV